MMKKKILALAAVAFVATLGLGAVAYNQANVAKAAEEETPVFAMVAGAQVRTTDPSGIRFVTTANAAYQAQLYTQFPEEEYTYVWGTVLTFDYKSQTHTIDALTKQWTANDTQWYTALVGIPESDYLTAITAQSYVKVYAADKSIAYEETVGNAQTRSIAQTASLALNSGKYSNDAILYAYTNTIPNASVEIAEESGEFIEGMQTKLTATVTKGYGIAWRSSDPTVATVDKDGVVTAVGAGTATITARLGTATDSYAVTVAPCVEKALIKEFYFKGDDVNPKYVHELSLIKGVVSEDNYAYGSSDLGDGSQNSSAMYLTLSSEYMATLFADAKIAEITFDMILSTGTAKIQQGTTEMTGDYTVSEGVKLGDNTYFTYSIKITRDRYNALNGKDMTIRYVYGGKSDFFYLDNLTLVEGEVVEEEVVLYENKLVTSFNKDSGNAAASRQTLTTNNTANGATDVFGISKISSNNSASMYFRLSKSYMAELFAIEGVTAITFDVIISTGTAKIQGPLNNDDEMEITVTSNSGSYYIYSVTITKARFETLSGDMRLRYMGGGSSTFFFVDNLALVK